jgi:hypothetical protein
MTLEKLVEKGEGTVLGLVLEPKGGEVKVRQHFRRFILNVNHRELFISSLK